MNDQSGDKTPQSTGESRPLSTADMLGRSERTAQPEQPPMMRNTGASGTGTVKTVTLLNNDQLQGFRSRWTDIQTEFVDEPRRSVEQADSLVAEVMQELARTFANEKDKLEGQWGRGQDVSTEDLRLALQRYRSFFDRLLSL